MTRAMKNQIFLIFSLIISCGDNHGHSDPDVDPPYVPMHEEVEPNDSFSEPQFITLLPVLSSEDIGGSLELPFDEDYYYFFLNPNLGDDEILFNAVVETDPLVDPRISLWQTVYDSFGAPTGDYQLIGTYIGVDGNLVILDIPVPYNSFTNNDLFMVLDGFGVGYEEYIVDFWTQ